MRRSTERGFSLAEVLTVVVIIGVLASLALPTYMKQRDVQERGLAIRALRLICQAEKLYLSDAGVYYGCNPCSGGDWGVLGLTDRPLDSDAASYAIAAAGGPPATFTATATSTRDATHQITVDQDGTMDVSLWP